MSDKEFYDAYSKAILNAIERVSQFVVKVYIKEFKKNKCKTKMPNEANSSYSMFIFTS